jgi:hypothetical protein
MHDHLFWSQRKCLELLARLCTFTCSLWIAVVVFNN